MQPSRQPRPPAFEPSRQPERNLPDPGSDLPDLEPNVVDPEPLPDWPAQRASTLKEPAMTTATHTARAAATVTAVDWTHLHADLSQPFPESELRYRAGATTRDKTKAQALPYVDPRAYEDRLNEIVPGNWEVTFEPWGEHRIICRLTIHGVTRSSTGEATDSPDGIAGTSAEAQAFKRACAKFGLGRYLYALTPQWVEYDATRRTVVAPTPRRQETTTDGRPSQPSGIGRERAADMATALERVGVAPSHQLGFAARTINRYVRDLAHLTDDEARAVWRAANVNATPQPTRDSRRAA
jgi:hypothetical protein